MYHFYIRVCTTNLAQFTFPNGSILVDDGKIRVIGQGRFASEVAALTFVLRNLRNPHVYGCTIRKVLGELKIITDISVDEEAVKAVENA